MSSNGLNLLFRYLALVLTKQDEKGSFVNEFYKMKRIYKYSGFVENALKYLLKRTLVFFFPIKL
ncbi:hypothetical protein GCM10028791_35260 [Echinicola sediminis]